MANYTTVDCLCFFDSDISGNYSFLNSSSEETIQGEETIRGRKLYEEIRYSNFLELDEHGCAFRDMLYLIGIYPN